MDTTVELNVNLCQIKLLMLKVESNLLLINGNGCTIDIEIPKSWL